MKVRTMVGLMVVGLVAAGPPAVRGVDVGSAFTYQGELLDGGVLVNGMTEFEFTLWDDPVAGTQQAAMAPVMIDVIQGRFTATVDLGGGAFPGQARWLEIAVTPPGAGSPTTLSRQELTPTPHAVRAMEGVGAQLNVEIDPVTGRVGIGTNMPGELLDVAGNITSSGTIESTVGGFKFPNGTTQTTAFGPNSVGSAEIINESITGADIANSSITGADIANSSIFGLDIANGTITGVDIANGTITGADIANSSITGADILLRSITASHIASNSFSSLHLSDEPGVARAESSAQTTLTVANQTLRVRTITVPTSGWVLSIATCEARGTPNTTGTQLLNVDFWISHSPSVGSSQFVEVQMRVRPGDIIEIPVTVHRLWPVSAGSHTFHFRADEDRGDWFVDNKTLALFFFATAYGPVTSTAAGSTESPSAGEDSDVAGIGDEYEFVQFVDQPVEFAEAQPMSPEEIEFELVSLRAQMEERIALREQQLADLALAQGEDQ